MSIFLTAVRLKLLECFVDKAMMKKVIYFYPLFLVIVGLAIFPMREVKKRAPASFSDCRQKMAGVLRQGHNYIPYTDQYFMKKAFNKWALENELHQDGELFEILRDALVKKGVEGLDNSSRWNRVVKTAFSNRSKVLFKVLFTLPSLIFGHLPPFLPGVKQIDIPDELLEAILRDGAEAHKATLLAVFEEQVKWYYPLKSFESRRFWRHFQIIYTLSVSTYIFYTELVENWRAYQKEKQRLLAEKREQSAVNKAMSDELARTGAAIQRVEEAISKRRHSNYRCEAFKRCLEKRGQPKEGNPLYEDCIAFINPTQNCLDQ